MSNVKTLVDGFTVANDTDTERKIGIRKLFSDNGRIQLEEEKLNSFKMRPLKFGVYDSVSNSMQYFEPTGLTIVESTGFKDKTGREIVEGDIVDTSFYNDRYYKQLNVVSLNPLPSVNGRQYQNAQGWTVGKTNSLADIAPFCEVVGNIYTNPIETIEQAQAKDIDANEVIKYLRDRKLIYVDESCSCGCVCYGGGDDGEY